MLSDEEKKAIKEVKHFNQLTRYWQEEEYEEKEIAEYITTLLNLIEKQSKEIEELKEKNNKLMEELDLTTVYISGVYDGKKKVQDKIKAKIEELDKMKSNGEYTILFNSDNVMEVIKAVLQSLLKKRSRYEKI